MLSVSQNSHLGAKSTPEASLQRTMLKRGLQLISLYLATICYSFLVANENCNTLEFSEQSGSLSLSQCEVFCVTPECKICRKICLSSQCQTEKQDCRIHEFLTRNCSVAVNRVNKMKTPQRNDINKTCEFKTGFLPYPQRKNGKRFHDPVDISEQCGKDLSLLNLFFKMRGTGTAILKIYDKEYYKMYRKILVYVYMAIREGFKPEIDISIAHKSSTAYSNYLWYLTKGYDCWLIIRKLQNGHGLISMGEGHIIGQKTLLNVSSNMLKDIYRVTAYSFGGNINWTFTI